MYAQLAIHSAEIRRNQVSLILRAGTASEGIAFSDLAASTSEDRCPGQFAAMLFDHFYHLRCVIFNFMHDFAVSSDISQL